MILGLGTDLCDVARIEKAIANPRFLERVYTDPERAHIQKRGAQSAAGLFAAKEAVAKALGTGFRGFSLRHIEVVGDSLGKPCCFLHEGARERLEALGGKTVWVSISHSGGFASATAIVEG